jgi:hypothetical protein
LTRTPSSIDVRHVDGRPQRDHVADLDGERNFIASTAAVTTRPPARRVAAIAATSSHSFMIQLGSEAAPADVAMAVRSAAGGRNTQSSPRANRLACL